MTVFPLTAAGARAFIGMTAGAQPDIFELLDQDEGWIQRDGTPIRLFDMSAQHRANTLAWLRRANWIGAHINMSYRVLSQFNGEMAQWTAETELDREFEEIMADPSAWLEAKPLVKRLVLLVAMDERKRRMVPPGPEWWEE